MIREYFSEYLDLWSLRVDNQAVEIKKDSAKHNPFSHGNITRG